MQLAFYLKELAAHGVDAEGELRFTIEKAREKVVFDEETIAELAKARRYIAPGVFGKTSTAREVMGLKKGGDDIII